MKIISIIKHLEDNLNENNVHQLEEKRQELIELRKKKVDGMIVRSRAKWIYEGEQNSKYFCNLEKRHFVQKAMCFIQKDDGNIIHDSNLITQEVKAFYENLYASRENNIIHCTIDNVNTPTLSQEKSDSLEGPITLQEALSSIKQMKNDKSPGSDGFTAEFFKFFFTDFCTFKVRSINYGFYSGQMSVTQREGVIVCIPKEGEDKQ